MQARTKSSRTRQETGGRTFLSAGAGLLLLLWVLAPTVVTVADCELTFEPTYVEVGYDSTVVQAIPSEEVGEFDNVTVDPDSGLEVSLVPDQLLQILVDATEGVEGEWAVTLNHGEMALCTGPLTVTDPDDPGR